MSRTGGEPSSFARRFLGWEVPLLPQAARVLFQEYADVPETGPVALDGVLVVVPGRRAGRRLTELLLDEAQRRGRVLRPPDVVTVGSVPDALGVRAAGAASGLQVRLAWWRALRDRATHGFEPLLPAPPESEDRGAWWALATQFASLRRELLGEGLDFPDVERRVEAGLDDDPERWHLLGTLATDVDRRLAEAGLQDPHRMTLEAARSGAGSSDGRSVVLVGTAELPATIRRILAGLDEEVVTLILAPEEAADAFREDGTVLEEAWLERRLPVEEGHLRVVDRPSDQARAVVEALAETDGRWGPDEIVVGLGDGELSAHVERALAARSVRSRYAPGRALESTRPAQFLRAVSDYLRGGEADALSALLRHPDLGARLRERTGSATDRDWLTALDAHRVRCLPARLPSAGLGARDPHADGFDGPPPPSSLSRILEELLDPGSGLLAPLQPLEAGRPLREWASAILELLLNVYGEDPLDRARPEERELVEALVSIRNRLAELSEVPSALDTPVQASEALDVVLREAKGDAIPPEPEARAVELLGWLELGPDDAPAVLVVGMNEGTIPEAVQGDPFLPDGLRSALGLVDNRRRYARDALAVTALVHSRPFVRFVAGRRDADGTPLQPSRLLLATEEEDLPSRVLRFVDGDSSAMPWEDLSPSPADGHHAATDPDPFPLPPEPEIRADPPLTTLRVTDFRLLLSDPYAFALQRVRRLETVDDTARELDSAAFGTLLHDVLKRFGESDVAGSTRPEAIRAFLEDTLTSRARALFGSSPLPAVAIQMEQARLRLRAFADAQAEWAGAGWRVAAVETSTPPGGGAPFPDDEGHPFHLTGAIDRIDHHPERRLWVVLDYKTGDQGWTPERNHRRGRSEDRRWVDLQLPLYRHLLPELEEPVTLPVPPEQAGPEHVLLGYVNLPRQRERTGMTLADWDVPTLMEADATAREVISYVRENRFRYDPDLAAGPFDPLVEIRGEEILKTPGRPGDSEGSPGGDGA